MPVCYEQAQIPRVVAKIPLMEPNIHTDDLSIVDGGYYTTNPIQRLDMAILKPASIGVKAVGRLIALGGETILIKKNQVFIHNKALKEPYKIRPCAEEKEGQSFLVRTSARLRFQRASTSIWRIIEMRAWMAG
jgi:Signal peptidase, peptidase S26